MEQKRPVDVMETPQMAAYMEARKRIEEDTALTELLAAYKASASKLIAMIQGGSFNPEAVMTLNDDTERMKAELEQNEKLIALESARQAVEALLERGEAVYTASCGGNCAACRGCASGKEREKEV